MKLNLSKPKTKNISRDTTPLPKASNKSIDASSKINNHFTELSITNSTQIQKRNQRTNSFGYNHTETYLNNSSKHFPFQQSLQNKSLSRKKSNNNFINRSIPSWNKVSISNNIPFRKGIKKNDNKKNKLLLNKMNQSTKNNILQHSFVITSSNIHHHLNTNSNHKESNTNEYNSENVSDRIEQKQMKEISGKLNQIQNDIFDLINNSSETYKGFILDELDKIYKNVLSYTTTHDKDNNNNHNLNVISHNTQCDGNIETIIAENENIRNQNMQLNKKMEEIEHKCNKVIKDNEMLKNDLKHNKEIMELLQDNVKNINQELLKIKLNKEGTSRKGSIMGSNRSEDNTLDNISLGDNTNVKAMSKLKGNVNKSGKEGGIGNNNNTSTAPGSTNISVIPNTKLQLNLPKPMDFNKEFLDNYEEFSPSWRKEADKIIQKRGRK